MAWHLLVSKTCVFVFATVPGKFNLAFRFVLLIPLGLYRSGGTVQGMRQLLGRHCLTMVMLTLGLLILHKCDQAQNAELLVGECSEYKCGGIQYFWRDYVKIIHIAAIVLITITFIWVHDASQLFNASKKTFKLISAILHDAGQSPTSASQSSCSQMLFHLLRLLGSYVDDLSGNTR